MIVGFTGNRVTNKDYQPIVKNLLVTLDAHTLYQGMADGADMMAAIAAIELDVSVRCIIPWADHRPKSAGEYQYNYDYVLANASEIKYVSPSVDYPGPRFYHLRNKIIVDRSDLMIACWNGDSSGGAFSAVRYAKSVNKPIYNVWEN